jgi:hypothetical protein
VVKAKIVMWIMVKLVLLRTECGKEHVDVFFCYAPSPDLICRLTMLIRARRSLHILWLFLPYRARAGLINAQEWP